MRAAASLTLALAASCGGGVEVAGGQPVNLLLVVLDTTRADHLSSYGYARPTTPAVDALAARGVRFASAWSQSSLTPVSAASFLSGAWPYRTGIRSLFVVGGETLSSDVPNLFERLRAEGRRTAGFVSAKPMGAHYGLSRGFDVYDDDMSATAARYGLERFADAPQRPGDETVDLALEWLDRNAAAPFALMVHMFDAHDPSFVPPRDFLVERMSLAVPEGLERINPRSGWPEVYRAEGRVELYDVELEFLSGQVQRLLDGLARAGVADDTVVCLISDHGEAFGEHDFWTHGILYQEQLHVPLVLAGPGIARGAVIDATVRLVDLAPTLLEHFGLDASGCDGVSFRTLLGGRGERDAEPPEVYAEVHHAAEDRLQRDTEMYSLALGTWKYIHRPVTGTHELYDLEQDPAELANLYRPDHPMAKILTVRLLGRGAVDGAVPDLEGIPEVELARLRELGYL
ncbi:MAG TPA: sulfatase [Planctomycetota bacterium]|nr:sulfatase [Planctomycetota bacterium]